jgi:hypothetical protein
MSNRKQASGELSERFYQSVAETLALLHTAPGYDRRKALADVAETLASTMGLPLVWIGRLEPDQCDIAVLEAAGPAAAYATSLQLSIGNPRRWVPDTGCLCTAWGGSTQ